MNKIKKTKILAKIADNRSDAQFIKNLFAAGADVAWLNTAHQDEPVTLEVMERIKSITSEIPIMIDTKGPEIRTKNIATPIEVKAGDYLIYTGDLTYTGPNIVQVSYPNFHNEVSVGKSILYDDASIEMVVEEKLEKGLKCIVKSPGLIKNKKSLNIPGVHIKLPALSDKDKNFIHFCAKHNVDYIIHSFVRNKEDIFEIKSITRGYPDYKPKIIAKIENREGFDNLEEILENCEGLMVARGDLGAEVPLEELPYMQKKMVEAALHHGKYCIVATQVLESMIKNPRPTRAEVTDIANAVLDGTDAISMSGETAYGDYPFEATKLMARVMAYTESKRESLVHFKASPKDNSKLMQEARLVLEEVHKSNAKAIFVNTKDINITRAISALRPLCPIYTACLNGEDQRELRLAYAVFGIKVSDLDIKSLAKSAEEFLTDESTVLIVEESQGGFVTATKKFGDLI
jgi:pyruvate kinase